MRSKVGYFSAHNAAPLIIGGGFPITDIPKLQEMGVKGFFGPGSSPDEAANLILQPQG